MVGKNCLWGNLFISKSILCIIYCLFLLLNVGYVGADTEAKLFIKYEKPLLSANIQGAKLSDVIRELKNKTGVDFNYRSLPDQIIYLSFANLSLKNGIKQTIPYGTIFVSDQNSSGEETIKSVYILTSLGLTQNKLQPVISSPIPSIETTPQKGIEYLAWQAKDAALAYQWLLQLQEEDPDKRLAAIIKLGKLGSNFFSVKGLYLALNDKDNRVRKTASEGLKRLDEQNIFRSLTEELQQIEPIIQKHALEVIKLQKGKKWELLLRQSIESNQIDTSLRKKAEEILLELQAKSRRN
ncbi:hypothetical protein OAL04_04365 [Nitrospinae bacterium]|nr:hypothetical protein [Nitrospinota bacterium]